MANHLLKSLRVGFRRRWLSGLRNGFGAVGLLWTLTEVLTRAIKPIDTYLDAHGTDFLLLMSGVFLGMFIGSVVEQRAISFKLPTTDTIVTLKFADLFSEDANILISVNEFFDGALGQAIEPGSLHGQFITKYYNGDGAAFRADVVAALAGEAGTQTARTNGPSVSYPIGTTPNVRIGPRRAFLMALTHTNLSNYKASASIPMLWDAMRGALQAVHDHGNGEPLAIPLVGNGQAGLNIAPQHLLRLLTLALVNFGRQTQLPKQVTIVLHDSCFENLDIREIRRDWSQQA